MKPLLLTQGAFLLFFSWLTNQSRRREGRGRPELQFELSPASQSLFRNQSAQMLGRLIGFLQEAGEQDLLETVFRTYWQDRLEEARGRPPDNQAGPRAIRSRLSRPETR